MFVLGQLLFLLFISEVFSILSNKLFGDADDSWCVLFHPQALELPSPLAVTSARLVSGVTSAGWNWTLVRDQDHNSLQVTHNASTVNPINYRRHCAGGVWWPWYIGSDIWFQDDFWEASSLGFQSSFSKALYLGEVLASIRDRSLLGRCFRRFLLLVLESFLLCGAQMPMHTLNYWTVLSAVLVFKRGLCFSVTLYIIDLCQLYAFCIRSCVSSVTRYTLYIVHYPCLMCQCGYTPYFGLYCKVLLRRTLVFVPLYCSTSDYRRTFISLSVPLWNELGAIIFDGVRLAGIKSSVNTFLFA